MSQHNTSVLLDRWNSGNRDALDELLRANQEWIRQQVRRRMTRAARLKAESMDLVNDAVFDFLKYAPDLKLKNGDQFRGLLRVIIERQHCEQFRWWVAKRRDMFRERPIPEGTVLDLQSPRMDPGDAVDKKDRESWIRMGLEFLKASDLEVVVLRDWDKLKFAEMGERLGKTKDAARTQYNRAVERLGIIVGKLRRGELGELGDSLDQGDGDGDVE